MPLCDSETWNGGCSTNQCWRFSYQGLYSKHWVSNSMSTSSSCGTSIAIATSHALVSRTHHPRLKGPTACLRHPWTKPENVLKAQSIPLKRGNCPNCCSSPTKSRNHHARLTLFLAFDLIQPHVGQPCTYGTVVHYGHLRWTVGRATRVRTRKRIRETAG